MRSIYSKTTNHKGSVPKNIRRIIECKDQQLRTGIISAIKYRAAEADIPIPQKIQLLRNDISNAPKHCLDIHTDCSKYFCNKTGDFSKSLEQLQFFGVWDDIVWAVNSLAYHSKSLLYVASNNAAEHFNSVVSKFIAGKRINYAGRRSYTARCEAAAISFNTGPDAFLHIQNSAGKTVGDFTTRFIDKRKRETSHVQKNRLSQNQQRIKMRKIQREVDNGSTHYGPNAATGVDTYQSDLCPELIEIRKSEFLNKLSEVDKTEIEEATRSQNNSPRWFVERRKRITASNFGKISKLLEKTPRDATVKNIMYPSFKGNVHTEYGNACEPIAIESVEKKLCIKIKRSGLLIDNDYPYLAASPDGLIDDTGMIEVKCPSSAQTFTPKEAAEKVPAVHKWCSFENEEMQLNVKHDYYFQIQGNLHISKREYCLFIFWTPLGFSIQKILRDDDFWRTRMVAKLSDFYINHYLIELIDSRAERELPIRQTRNKREN